MAITNDASYFPARNDSQNHFGITAGLHFTICIFTSSVAVFELITISYLIIIISVNLNIN